MKNKIKKISGIVIFFIGFLIFIYPTVSKIINNYLIQRTIENYKKDMASINISGNDENNNKSLQLENEINNSNAKKELDELFYKMKTYNENIFNEGQKKLMDPFSYEVVSFDLSKLGFNDNIVGYLTIPKMEIEVPIYLGATQENMKKGAGHLSETSIPIGGNNTNSVIAAHRGMRSHPMFRNIEMLEIGDEIKVTNMWDELIYKVVETKVISPDEVSEVLIQEGRDLITLITCHPYTKNYQRYVVYCEKQEGSDVKAIDVVKQNDKNNKKVYNIIYIENFIRDIGIIIIVFFSGYIVYKIIRKNKVNK